MAAKRARERIWIREFMLLHRDQPIVLRVRLDPDVLVIENPDRSVNLHAKGAAPWHRWIGVFVFVPNQRRVPSRTRAV